MATIVTATCSECFQDQEVELSPRRNEIVCKFCRHSVPMFEKRELDSIRSQIAAERRKMYIALMIFGGGVFLFVLYFLATVREHQVLYTGEDGEETRLDFVECDDASITVLNSDGDEEKLSYATILSSQIAQIKQDFPLMNDDQAAKRAGEEHIAVVPREGSASQILFYLSILAGLASVVFAAIASQERLVCEF